MNKMYIFILLNLFSLTILEKYHSDYYNNVTNILNKFPKVDIDYIFSKPSSENDNKDNNPSSNLFRNIFYDYYQTSVPLYDEKMKCYFPLKKNISLKLDSEYDNTQKTKNISKFLGKYFLKSLKGKCEQFYVERWYYTLCPLLGAMQTLSYIKSEDNPKQKEKQEVNYLGYEFDDEINNTIFLKNIDETTKKFFEKKYSNELNDIYEENLFDNNGENSKMIGIYNNFINFYGNKVFDSNKFPEKNKIFKLEYKTFTSDEIKTISADILKIVNDHLIVINETLSMNDLIKIKKVNKIKILKQENKRNLFFSFFNQSFFLYDEYVYSSKINLYVCSNKNCFITISNQDDNKYYKIETIVDPKFAILDSSVQKNIKSYEKERYCVFLEDDKLYFYGQGDIEELIETEDPNTFILFGENLNIENSDEILLLFNGTSSEYDNVVVINSILDKFIRIKYESRINATHYKVKMVNKQDIIYFEKQVSLDDKYIIVKYNPKATSRNESRKKLNHTYYVLGNEKNISLTNKSFFPEIKEGIIISENIKANDTKKDEENKFYTIENNQEFIVTFELSPYNEYYKESHTSLCLSEIKKCQKGDYEILFDMKNNGIVINQINDDNNEPKAFTSNKINIGEKTFIYGIIYMNSSFYINNYFGTGKNKGESEIILKYKITEGKKDINYLILNKYKSKNIFINDIKFYNNVAFDIFKNIYIYNQKYLLDDKTIYIDTFEKGDYCDPIKAYRKVIINYICDEEGIYDLKLMNVYEDKKNICVYNYYAKSRLLCNPNTMMKNYEKFSPVKTFCYLDN